MTRQELLGAADALAVRATTWNPKLNHNTPGNIAQTRESLVQELEAMRLTILAVFGPLAEVADIGIALLATLEDEAGLVGPDAPTKEEQSHG